MQVNSTRILMNEHSFDGYFEEFISWMQLQGWSERTIETYTGNIQQFIQFVKEETEVTHFVSIDAQVLFRYQHSIRNRQSKSGKLLSQSGVHSKLVSFRSFLKYLHLNGLIHLNPELIIKLPLKRQPLPRNILSEEQTVRLLSRLDVSTPLGIRNRAILEVLYACGIRKMELRNLTIYDIEIDQRQVAVHRGKNRKDRMIPMGEAAARWIDLYLRYVRHLLLSASSGTTLFLSKTGRKITRANLIWIVSKQAKEAGLIPPVTPHILRHTCATHMLRHGADIRYIQGHLGHASVATTQIYTRVLISDLHRVFRETHPRAVKM